MKWKLTTIEERKREMSLAAEEARGEAEELLSQCSATDSHDQSSMVSVCVSPKLRERERERERERVVYWRVCTVHNGIGGVHFTSVWVRRPNGFGQDQWDYVSM